MIRTCSTIFGLAVVGASTLVAAATLYMPTQDAGPAACRNASHLPAGAPADLQCLSQSKRVELLSRPLGPPVIPTQGGDYRLHSALHRLKAREAEALAVADTDRRDSLAAYLNGRTIEAMRSDALRDAEAAIVRSSKRVLLLGVELKAATRAANDWISRQPGRELPGSYRQRIVHAAQAIHAEHRLLALQSTARDEVNRVFDREVHRILSTLQAAPHRA